MLNVHGPARTGPDALAHLKTGSAHLQRGEAGQAVREFKAAVALDPQSAAAHMLLGQACLALRSPGMIAEAKAELQQALDLDPHLFWARFYLARVCMDPGRYDRAKQELEQGLKARPNVAHFLALLGEVNRKLGRPEASIEPSRRTLEAEAAVKRGIALDPSRPEGHLNLAQLYNLTPSSDRALAELKLALPEGKSCPASPYYQQFRAGILFERGRAWQGKRMAAQAIQAYPDCLASDPNPAHTHRRLAELYSGRGDAGRARAHTAAARKLAACPAPRRL